MPRFAVLLECRCMEDYHKLAHIQIEGSESRQYSPCDRDIINSDSRIYRGKRATDKFRVYSLAFTRRLTLVATLRPPLQVQQHLDNQETLVLIQIYNP